VITGLDCGQRRKTTCEGATYLVTTSPVLDETLRGKAIPDASTQALRTSPTVTAGDTESTAIQTAYHIHQRRAFTTQHTHTHYLQLLTNYTAHYNDKAPQSSTVVMDERLTGFFVTSYFITQL